MNSKFSELSEIELENLLLSKDLRSSDALLINKELKLRVELNALSKPSITKKQGEIIRNSFRKKFPYKPILSTSIMVFGLIYIVIRSNYLSDTDSNYYADYDKTTYGSVYEIGENTTTSQGFEGMSIMILGYTVKYSYNIDEKHLKGSVFIPNKEYHYKHIKYIKKNIGKELFPIKYKTTNHKESIIDLHKMIE